MARRTEVYIRDRNKVSSFPWEKRGKRRKEKRRRKRGSKKEAWTKGGKEEIRERWGNGYKRSGLKRRKEGYVDVAAKKLPKTLSKIGVKKRGTPNGLAFITGVTKKA